MMMEKSSLSLLNDPKRLLSSFGRVCESYLSFCWSTSLPFSSFIYFTFVFFSYYFIIIVYVNYFSFSGAINLPVQYCSLVLCRISASFFFSYLFILHISKTLFKWSRKSHKIWDHNIYKYILWYISGKNKNIFHQFFDQKKIFHQFSLSPINR